MKLRQICRNLALDVWRRRKRTVTASTIERRQQEIDERPAELGVKAHSIEAGAADPEEIVAAAATVAAVRAALARLPDRMREVMRMLALEEKTVPEVAEALGIGEQTVRNYAARAREALRRLLKGEQP